MLKRIFMVPPLILLLSLLVALIFSFYLPLYRINNSVYQGFGYVFILFGLILDFWSLSEFRKAKTTIIPSGKPTFLIMSGPFAFSRNAIYLGYVLILVGLAIIIQSLAAFIAPILMFLAMNIYTIPEEEKILFNEFGVEYNTYKEKVRRWFGAGK
ncbi:MAG: isoprenylcysteine carboxylmethyltransferase family protein [bacterium]|nr:isoprenylcysteine carboxylmethyltransferase family protein [bacterium]